MKKTLLTLVLAALAVMAGRAQPPGRPRVTAEEIAQQRTVMLSEKIGLDGKQYKKVYKIYLKQARDMMNARPDMRGNRPQGGPGMGSPGGMPGGPGGVRGGGPGGMGPGMPGSGMRGGPGGGPGGQDEALKGADRSGRPPRGAGQPWQEDEKGILRREKKMKKILSVGQFDQWSVIDKEMRYERFRENFMKLEPDKDQKE